MPMQDRLPNRLLYPLPYPKRTHCCSPPIQRRGFREQNRQRLKPPSSLPVMARLKPCPTNIAPTQSQSTNQISPLAQSRPNYRHNPDQHAEISGNAQAVPGATCFVGRGPDYVGISDFSRDVRFECKGALAPEAGQSLASSNAVNLFLPLDAKQFPRASLSN